MTPVSLLEQVPLFKSFKPSERQHLAALLRRQTIKKGDVLFRKGDDGNAFYIITRGRIKIILTSGQEDEITLSVFTKGDFFGEMSLLDGMPRSADAVAMVMTNMYVLDRKEFMSFLIRNVHTVQSILYTLSMRLRKTDSLLGETAFLNISTRLIKRLLDLVESEGQREEGSPAVRIDITQKELASLVGVCRESINKNLKVLCKKGLVTTSRNAIIVHDPELLKRPPQSMKL